MFTVYLPVSQRDLSSRWRHPNGRSCNTAISSRAWSGNGTAEVLDERAARRGLDDHPFESTTVLVIDDDFRNVFAMTALLERAPSDRSVSAESGAAAIESCCDRPRSTSC